MSYVPFLKKSAGSSQVKVETSDGEDVTSGSESSDAQDSSRRQDGPCEDKQGMLAFFGREVESNFLDWFGDPVRAGR